MGTSVVFSTSVKRSLLVTWPACGVTQRQVTWTRGCALNLDSGASAATVHLLPFPACQINSPTDLVPRLNADKRTQLESRAAGPRLKKFYYSCWEEEEQEAGLEQEGRFSFCCLWEFAFNRWDTTVTQGCKVHSRESGRRGGCCCTSTFVKICSSRFQCFRWSCSGCCRTFQKESLLSFWSAYLSKFRLGSRLFAVLTLQTESALLSTDLCASSGRFVPVAKE